MFIYPIPAGIKSLFLFLEKVHGEETKQRINSYMKGKVSPYKVPKIIEFMNQLPMSAVGKVLKRELRTMIRSK
jgi:long-chain acyl-CoA synthetase